MTNSDDAGQNAGTPRSPSPQGRMDAIADVAHRWDLTVNEADAFLESAGYVDESYERCPACFRHLEDTDGDPVPAYGKKYCRSCGSSLFDSVSSNGVSRGD